MSGNVGRRAKPSNGSGSSGAASKKARRKQAGRQGFVEEEPVDPPMPPLSLLSLQEACCGADLYGLLQLLKADSDDNLQLAWFWNATRFVDAGVDHPEELGSLLATRITPDLMNLIYARDTATLGLELQEGRRIFAESGIDVNAPLLLDPSVSPPLHPRESADFVPNPAGADEKSGVITALHVASDVGHAGIAHVLLQLRADPHIRDPSGLTPLCAAARHNFNLVVDEILRSDQVLLKRPDDRASPERALYDRSQQTAGSALLVAAREGNSKIVQLLLDSGVNPSAADAQGVTALQHAASNGQLLIVQRLLGKGASLQNDAMCRAASSGNLATVVFLRDAGADVNVRDASGLTPLICAALENHLEVVEYLCLEGADVDARPPAPGASAVVAAAQAGHVQVFKYLSAARHAKDSKAAAAALPAGMKAKARRQHELDLLQQQQEEMKDLEQGGYEDETVGWSGEDEEDADGEGFESGESEAADGWGLVNDPAESKETSQSRIAAGSKRKPAQGMEKGGKKSGKNKRAKGARL